MFLIFTSICFVMGLALTMIYKQKSDEKMHNMDESRFFFRQHYQVCFVNSVILTIAMIIMYVIPRYSNIIYYRSPNNIEDSEIGAFKALFSLLNMLLIISWLLASAFNSASITDMDCDPEDGFDETLSIMN